VAGRTRRQPAAAVIGSRSPTRSWPNGNSRSSAQASVLRTLAQRAVLTSEPVTATLAS
jgi:hypothetical protein